MPTEFEEEHAETFSDGAGRAKSRTESLGRSRLAKGETPGRRGLREYVRTQA